ncbi:MAG: hypothetical protein MUF64_02835 [Polyangiaceae bacterium]|nr:hypothetical protein [Polyangiaceae bacterium]
MRSVQRLLELAAAVGLATTLFAPAAWAEQRGNNVHVEDQLEQDLTPLPAGMGAVFVPSLTSASQEPAVVVERQGERLASGPTGGRIVVPPGSYRVLIGLGDNDGKAAVEVEVKEGKTAVVKPFFGAVRINLVSASGEAVAGDYVIASVDRKQSYGPVSMEKGPKAHAQPSWLLPPGRYVVVFGRNPEARENSFAFTVTAGEIARYRLVIDGDRVVRSEFGDDPVRDTEKIWRLRWVIGASGSLTRNQSTFNGVQGQWLFGNAFSRFEAGIDTLQHLALLRLNVDQTFLGVKDEYGHQKPIRPYTNEVEGELLYNFRVAGAIGPYARGLARTSLLASNYIPERDVTVVTRDVDGRTLASEQVGAGDKVTTFEAFSPLQLQQGAGAALTILDRDVATLVVRAGASARQAYYGNGRYPVGRDGNVVDMLQLGNNKRFGGELTAIAGLRLSQIVSVETRFDSFVPSSQLGETIKPIFRWDTAATVRLGQLVSLVYTYSLRRDELGIPSLQHVESLALRLNHALF